MPRYDAITRGSSRTSAGVPSAITAPASRQYDAVRDAHDQRHVVLDHEHRRAQLALDAHDQRPERLRLALRDAAGRFVEQQHARVDREQRAELDDPTRAGRQVRDELVAVAAEPEEVDQLGGFDALAALGRRRRREAGHRRDEPRSFARLERNHDRLAHRQRGIQPRRLEAAAEPVPVPAVRGLRR